VIEASAVDAPRHT